MFNTDIIYFLQTLDHPLILGLMLFISALGLTPIIMFMCLSIAFTLDLKKGLVLINIVAWTAFVTVVMKDQINYPRPADIDPSIEIAMDGRTVSETNSPLGPKGFFEGFSKEFLEQSRNDEFIRKGFPSGHASIQTALWLSFFLLFRKRWILYSASAIILLTGVSRLYLGFHFLADVLGGVALGLTITYFVLWIIKKSRYLEIKTHDRSSLGFFWLPWIILPLAPFVGYWQIASVLGLNMAVIYVIQRRNFPVFHVITWKRILASLIVIAAFLGTFYLNSVVEFTSLAILDFLIITLLNFLAVLGALSLGRRLFLIKYRLAF